MATMGTQLYNPKPLDTSQIQLSDEILRLTEFLAENAHDVWAKERLNQGWTHGPHRDDEKKEHPCLIPYRELPEYEKKFDRNAAQEVIKTLLSLGYRKTQAETDSVVGGGELEEKAANTLAYIKKAKVTVPELRRLWEERIPLVWFRNVQIYRRAVDKALQLGEAFLAFDMALEGLRAFKDDLRLIQLQALALARTGATKRANQILDQLRLSGHKDEETLGILARTHKDFWLLAVDPKEKAQHLKLSFELYAEGYRRNRGYYTGINAAAMGLIYGERELARQWAQEVTTMCEASLANLAPESEERYWLEATLAEAYLIMGHLARAQEYYSRASTGGQQSWVTLNRTRGQARLLLEHSGADRALVDPCFKLPRIVVVSGHMLDRLNRKQPRFPYWLEEAVRSEVRVRLAKMEAQVGFGSLACGADMVFAESLLERGGEINVVFPFRQDDFKQSSVDIIPGRDYSERFDKILKNAATVTTLNELGTANDGAAYEYCNLALIGLALLKGQFLGIDVMPLAVWDGKIGDGRGGTQSFVDFWEEKGTKVELIRLDKMLAESAELQSPAAPAVPAAPAAPAPAATPAVEEPQSTSVAAQEIKAMLFADIKGYTKLSEIQIPAFVHHFLGRVASVMDGLKRPPIVKNTWGDAVYCVFDHVSDAGVFALLLRDLVRGTDWTKMGLPSDLNIRIALHAGPAYPCFDPVLRRLTFLGSHVNRTARIEPVAEEGQVYASQAFAALAAADNVKEFNCDYVGLVQLAKKYGSIPVFLVRPMS
jgi:class 3 adenylate cyclase